MVTTREEEQLLSIYQLFVEHQFIEGQRIVLALLRKKQNNFFHIAFCGHYSSGKSTFINYLFEENILPTSPIPTSGNIVQISKGHNETIIHYIDGKVEKYGKILENEQLQLLCMNSEEILKIEMNSNDLFLEDGVTVIDTPGIDSTDDIHQASTESIIPTVDMMYYVVDYQHVHLEMNIQFVKKMKEQGKKVILVVNQIDKHNEQELSFDKYRQGIISLFSEMGTREIYFISLKNKKLACNELDSVKKSLDKYINDKESLIKSNDESELQNIVDSFHNELLLEYGDVCSYEELELELLNIRNEMNDIELDYRMKVDAILRSAQLITYEVRKMIGLYLESIQPTFRVSIFNKKKTFIEQEKRFNQLYELLLLQIQVGLINPFIKVVQLFVEDKHIYGAIPIINKELIEDRVVNGVSHNAISRFASDLEYKIIKVYKKFYYDYYVQFKDKLNNTLLDREQEVIEQIKIREIVDEKQQQLQNILQGEIIPSNKTLEDLLHVPYSLMNMKNKRPKKVEVQQKKLTLEITTGDILSKSKKIEQLLVENPIFSQMLKNMQDKRRRIEQKTFTVVLFGAFSAGKSSLINGLLGSKILPSSPNPTTSIITYIKAPNKENLNLTAKIFTKNDTKRVRFEKLNSIIANEEIAKDIEKVEIYFDCIWTRMGIVFVDTPGISSVNKRHTELSFSYMREADVIMYVSYYHHSFSKSDKEFLYQLGRVKESTVDDNIIFILNGIDLAENDAEINMVQNYLTAQLKKSGIIDPTIFGVSSKYLNNNDSYHQKFIQYLEKDMINRLQKQSLESLRMLLMSTYNQINVLIQNDSVQQMNKDLEIANLNVQLKKDEETINCFEIKIINKDLNVECSELFFYVKKRLMIRCREIFMDCFHPSTVKVKSDLQIRLYEFIQLIENSITQEILATTLRIENYIIQLLKREVELLQPDLQFELDLLFSTPDLLEVNLSFPTNTNFKNTKLYFEGNGREEMFGSYLKIYEKFIDKYLKEVNLMVQLSYQEQLMVLWNNSRNLLIEELRSKNKSMIQLLGIVDITPMKQLKLNMEKILNS